METDERKNDAPTLVGRSVSYMYNMNHEMDDPNQELDVWFSPDIRAEIMATTKQECKRFEQQCVNKIYNIIKHPDTEADPGTLEPRQFVVGTLVAAFSSIIIGLWMRMDPNYDPMGIHFGKGTITPEGANNAMSAYYIIPVTSSNNQRHTLFSPGLSAAPTRTGSGPLAAVLLRWREELTTIAVRPPPRPCPRAT